LKRGLKIFGNTQRKDFFTITNNFFDKLRSDLQFNILHQMIEKEINKIEYIEWLNSIKVQIHQAQIKAALSVNSELINLYWEIGKSIVEKQEIKNWGNSVVEKLSNDLKNQLENVNGFSRTNLFAMRQFYQFYKSHSEKVPQLVGQIPWGHNRLILNRKPIGVSNFTITEIVPNNLQSELPTVQQIENELINNSEDE